MNKNFLILRRINTLIDRMKTEEDIECRRMAFVAVRARIKDLNNSNPGNSHMNEKSQVLIQYLKWLAHIDHPGHNDNVYIEEIDKAVKDFQSPSGSISMENAAGNI